jgi:DNA-binding MarR family transcriptional regulator
MDDSLNKKELETTHYLHACIGDILSLLSLHFKGHTTLNDLRIGNFIGLMSHYDTEPTSNKRISAKLGIPRSTVSRIVTDFIEQKWVTEHPHPEDGRKKQLSIATGHPLADNFEKDFRVIINDLLERFESNKIVRVDPSKKSY